MKFDIVIDQNYDAKCKFLDGYGSSDWTIPFNGSACLLI